MSGRFSVNNPRAIQQAVLAGQGIVIMPLWLMDGIIKKGEVEVILDKYVSTPLEIYVIYPDQGFVPAKVRCIIDSFEQSLIEVKIL